MQMSIEKYANVQKVFDEIILEYGIANGYKGLADWLGVPYQTLMAWKKRGRIGDYSHFMDKGISKAWLQNMQGPIVSQHVAAAGLTNPSIYSDQDHGPGAAAKGLTPVVADSRQTVMFAGDPPALRLRKDQAELLREWDRLNKEDQQLIIDVMRSMARKG